MILFNCTPFQMGTSLKGKNLLPGGANFFSFKSSSLYKGCLESSKHGTIAPAPQCLDKML